MLKYGKYYIAIILGRCAILILAPAEGFVKRMQGLASHTIPRKEFKRMLREVLLDI